MLLRVVVRDDENRQRPRTHWHLTSNRRDVPIGNILTIGEQQESPE